MLESVRLSFLDSGEDKNCNVSLSNNLDQKYDYTTKIMMDKFSESWRSVLKCVLSLTSVECSIFSKKNSLETIHYNEESICAEIFDESPCYSQWD